MTLKTVDQWREAVVERRIERVRQGSHDHFLDQIVERLASLSQVADWMVLPLVDAAVEEWESRNYNFRIEYDRVAAQHARHEAQRRCPPEEL